MFKATTVVILHQWNKAEKRGTQISTSLRTPKEDPKERTSGTSFDTVAELEKVSFDVAMRMTSGSFFG